MANHEPSIQLSKDRGINPRMTTCVRCGAETPTLALLGDGDHLLECTACHQNVLGKKRQRKCPSCGAFALSYKRRLGEYEKIPMGLCDTCEASDKEMEEVVKKGGIYWKCADCGSGGAIKAESHLAKAVREQSNIKAPDPVGCEFTKNDCPVCGPNPVEQT